MILLNPVKEDGPNMQSRQVRGEVHDNEYDLGGIQPLLSVDMDEGETA